MPKILFSLCLLISLCLNSFAQEKQKNIIPLDREVIDSVQYGMKLFSQKIGKPVDKLKFYVIMLEGTRSYDVLLNEYSQEKGFKHKALIDSTNNFLKINEQVYLPSIFDYDLWDRGLKKGYMISVKSSDGKEVISTKFHYQKK